MLKIVGLSNKLDNSHNLFFWEFDNITKKDIFGETAYISKLFNIDIFVSESSPNNYHLISFDVLTRKKVLQIQRNIRIDSDYTPLDEQNLFGNKYEDNCLRLSYKGEKESPKYVFSILEVYRQKPQIAINHFNLYKKIVGIPEFVYFNKQEIEPIPYEPKFVIYQTGKKRRLFNN